jgi:hypothetical protein
MKGNPEPLVSLWREPQIVQKNRIGDMTIGGGKDLPGPERGLTPRISLRYMLCPQWKVNHNISGSRSKLAKLTHLAWPYGIYDFAP